MKLCKSYAMVLKTATLLAGTSLITVVPQTYAQTTGAQGQMLQEIIVTAERRSQSLQDVPISATVLDADALAAQGVTGLLDLQQVAPAVSITTYNRSTFINIRGVGSAFSAPTNSSGVAYYIDGQFIPKDFTIGYSFFDLGSVEVLRGPQGTLTGQNSTGGAVYVRTPDPKFDEFSGYVQQTIGEYSLFRTDAAINVPIAENLALRVAGTWNKQDSFSDQIGTSPSQPGNANSYAFRANLLFEPAPWLGINLRWTHFGDNNDNNAVQNRDLVSSLGAFKITEDGISFQRNSGDWISGEVRADISDGIRWRTNISYADAVLRDQTDGDRTSDTPPPVGRIGLVRTDDEDFIVETNLLSTDDSPFQWIVGAFYLDSKIPVKQQRDQAHTITFLGSTKTTIVNTTNKSKAVFGQINYKILPAMEVIVGGRYSEDRQHLVATTGVDSIAKSEKFTGRFAVNFYPAEGMTVYGSVARGYKAGGVNIFPGVAPFEPESNTVYELGFKGFFLDRRLRLNGDVFYSDYNKIQFNSLFNGFPTLQNAASSKSKGFEIEATGLFGNFMINGGLSYNDAGFAEGVCLNNGNDRAGNPVLCPDGATGSHADDYVKKGDALPFSPKWTINAGIQYQIDIGDGATVTPRLQYSHTGGQIATPFRSAETVIPAYDLVNARITIVPAPRYVVELYATNLFDKTFIAAQIQNTSTAAGGIIYGPPRQFGLRATVKFGDL